MQNMYKGTQIQYKETNPQHNKQPHKDLERDRNWLQKNEMTREAEIGKRKRSKRLQWDAKHPQRNPKQLQWFQKSLKERKDYINKTIQQQKWLQRGTKPP